MGLKITLSGQTIVKPTALGPVANTDTKLLIYGAISKGPSFDTGRGRPEPNFDSNTCRLGGHRGQSKSLAQ